MNVSEQRAEDLVDTLQALYGSLFINSLKGLSLQKVRTVATGVISTLSDEQFNHGMAMLNAKSGQGGYCPTIAEFKTWCMSGSWWSVDEAWQRACDYSNQSAEELQKGKLKITTLTKKAWDSVHWSVEQGNMKAAFGQFKSIYETYLAKAQLQGRHQEWYVPPMMIEAPKVTQVEHKAALKGDQEAIQARTAELAVNGMSWAKAFKQAQMEIRGEVKPTFGSVA